MVFLHCTRAVVSLLLGFALTAPVVEAKGPSPNQIKNLITFGDSYTDVVATGDAGTAWPVYAAEYADLHLFPFARSGATCSNNLTSKPFPSVFESQLPLYFTEKSNGTLKAAKPEDTIYTLWIGTNDVGVNAIFTGSQTPGVTLVNTTNCAVNWVKTLYDSGARNFIFQNMNPLQDVILYSSNTYPNRYWTEAHNATEWSLTMTEYTISGNALSLLLLERLAPTLPGAHLGYFDSHGLFSDMVANPHKYLNGTAPLNVTGCITSCVYGLNEDPSGPANCVSVTGTDRDSYLWYDELHPSEQADRQLAKAIAAAIRRESEQWITWLS